MHAIPITTGMPAERDPPFSQGLRVGEWVFLSGQGSIGADGAVVEGTIEEQTELTFENIRRLLGAAGCELSDVVSVLVHLADLELFARYNAAYERHFAPPRPVRTTVGAQLLFGLLIEVTVVARHPGP